MAIGSTTTTAQNRRPGRRVRSTHHAAPSPIAPASTVTATASRTVFHSSWTTSGRSSRWLRPARPSWLAWNTRNPGVSSTRAATRSPARPTTRPGAVRARRPSRGGALACAPAGVGGTCAGGCSAETARSERAIRPPPSVDQPDVLEQRQRPRSVPEVGDRDVRRVEIGERDRHLGGGDPGADRVLVALAAGDDLLTLDADQEGKELLRLGLLLR